MNKLPDLFLAALAPIIWGSTYIVTTEMLPPGYPLTSAVLRALPAGLLLLLVVKRLPSPNLYIRIFILGALNFSIFWSMLFISAYKLPGGIAATLGSIQPLLVFFLSKAVLGSRIHKWGIVSTLVGIVGVAFLVITPDASLDLTGIIAALIAALSMAAGIVLTRKWQPPVSSLTFASWQLTAGGLLLLPIALYKEPSFPMPTWINLVGYTWLGMFGAAFTYYLWFRGIARLGPTRITALGFLSPISAVLLGWLILGQELSLRQIAGVFIILISTYCIQRSSQKIPSE